MSVNSFNARPVLKWMTFAGIKPIIIILDISNKPNNVPKKKYLNGRPTIGAATFTETFGINGVNLKNNI